MDALPEGVVVAAALSGLKGTIQLSSPRTAPIGLSSCLECQCFPYNLNKESFGVILYDD